MTRSIPLLLTAAFLAAPLPGYSAEKNYRGKDLTRKELANENFDRADLTEATLQWANLKNATFKGADLRRADLSHARLETADFTGADLRGAKLNNATLTGARFIKANLQGAEVFCAYGNPTTEEGTAQVNKLLDNLFISKSILKEENGLLMFKEADLKNATIRGQLDGVDFRRADLRGADLQNTKDAEPAKFRGAIYDKNTRWPANFDFAKAGAVEGETFDAVAAAAAIIADFNWTGKWMIEAEPNGAKESGSLHINKDNTYMWDYSTKAKPVTGKWKTTGAGIVLERGEAGQDWTVEKQKAHPDRKDSIELKSAVGGLQRWAVPVH